MSDSGASRGSRPGSADGPPPGDVAPSPPHLWVDADSCPVKEEVYKVAKRHGLEVTLVTNRWFRTPGWPWLHMEVVKEEGGLDAADDWIVEHMAAGDLVVTEDILLAQRCLEKEGYVLTPRGHEYDRRNIGEAVASRELLAGLREAGQEVGGPAPFQKRDRSTFLQELENLLRRIERAG